MIDPLEPRRLMAIASIFNGVLRVFGQEHGDFIQVDVGIEKTVLTYENAYQEFFNSAYNSIEIRAGDGPDWIRLTGQFSRPGLIDGEVGNDTILGSQQIETLVGGAGNDVIYYQVGDVINAQEAGLNEFLFGTPPPTNHPTLIGGVLRLTGLNFSDTTVLNINPHSPYLSINYSGGGRIYDVADIQSIIIDGRGGNDRIQINPTVFLPTRLYGGAGNDTILGGAGSDRVYGGEGNDWISGNGGNDIIYGENGNDRLFGGNGRDYLVGGAGSDVMRGETGADQILARSGEDDFRGNTGDLITLV